MDSGLDEQIMEFFKDQPCLWDVKHALYYIRTNREA